jgi:hypothetical protein
MLETATRGLKIKRLPIDLDYKEGKAEKKLNEKFCYKLDGRSGKRLARLVMAELK